MSEDNPQSGVGSSDADPRLFSRTLKPHRSLSRRGLNRLLMLLSLFGIIVSIPFYLMGAWPVVGFFGLDVLILFIAFSANMRAARAYEQVEVTHVELSLQKVTAKGQSRIWRFNPSWARIHTERHEEFGTQKIAIVQGRQSVEVGGFLGADDKDDFARSFKTALGEAKRGRIYNP